MQPRSLLPETEALPQGRRKVAHFFDIQERVLAKKAPPPCKRPAPLEAALSKARLEGQSPAKSGSLSKLEQSLVEFLNTPDGARLPSSPSHSTGRRSGEQPVQGDLCDAAARGNVDALRRMLAQGLLVDQGDYDRRTALHLAASEGLLDVVKFLVDEAGADPSPVDRWGGTPLDDAVRSQHALVVSFLRAKHAKVGRTSSASTLENASVELCDAAAKGDLPRLTHLVKGLGVDVNEGDYDKRTAIHLAASEGLLDVVRLLVLTLKADHSPVDRWGNTPLDDAVRSKHTPVSDFLRRAGGTMGNGVVGAPREAPTAPMPTAADLCDAAFSGDVPRLRGYIAHGLEPNLGDYDRRTALHLAASEGLLDVVKFLVDEAGADPSPVDRWGNTPLDDACRGALEKHEKVRAYLESKGATRAKFSKVAATGSRSCTLL